MQNPFQKKIRFVPFWLSLICFLGIIFDFGFDHGKLEEHILNILYLITLAGGVVSTVFRYIHRTVRPHISLIIIDVLSVGYFIFLIVFDILELEILNSPKWNGKGLLYSALLLVFIREYSSLRIRYGRSKLNPAQLFVLSFLTIIIFGSGMLLLPNATPHGISFTNALFTSTSAVCVTGLIVVDTSTQFTVFGQTIILILIQIGGLGIMTFASYFAYFFKGGSSYENQLMLREITNSDKIGDVFNTLKKIIILTLGIEAIGALLIFTTLDFSALPSTVDQTFFSIFHSISAFCNAGFSTLSENLYNINFRYNYSLQLIIMFLFIIGGLGFPIVFNLYKYTKYLLVKRLWPSLLGKKNKTNIKPWVVNLNSRIVLITTGILLLSGGLIIYISEYNQALAGHQSYGKIITAFFTAASPRTAGFNTIDYSSLQFSSLLFIYLLMWIGGSPGGTAGGIKTSSFAIATLNFWSLARGKDRIEVFRREIASISIQRAFAIMTLSVIAIGTAIFFIAILDPDKDLLSIAFECFSAYSTVGLSIGITSSFSEGSKYVLILLMFVGRVGMLYILIAFLRRMKYKNYHYSKEKILIN